MAYEDRTLTCVECAQEFTFTADDQEFHARKGYQDPKRCPNCRQAAAWRSRRRWWRRLRRLPSDVRRHMRQLRQADAGAVHAAAGPAGLLRRLLRQDEAGALGRQLVAR